jgi:hypothetical protein
MLTESIVKSYLTRHHPDLVVDTPLVTLALAYELGNQGQKLENFDLTESTSYSELMERAVTRMREEMSLDTVEDLDRIS